MKKKKKVTYKVWMVVEKCTEEDGEQNFEDLEDDTQAAGTFDTYEEAVEQMDRINAENVLRFLVG